MDNRLVSLLESIAAAVEEGRVSIYIDSNRLNNSYQYDDSPADDKEDWGMIPMLRANVDDYLKEHHQALIKEMVSPVMMARNGDVLIKTSQAGLDYYKDHKQELFQNIHLKGGAAKVYLYATDVDECWMQTEPDYIVRDMGQVPEFGAESTNTDDQQYQEEYAMTEDLANHPLLTMQELLEQLPEPLSTIQLNFNDVTQIMQILQNRLSIQTFENIEQLLYERET